MGGEPKLALNLLCIPESMPKDAVHQLLRGGYDKAYEAGESSSRAATASSIRNRNTALPSRASCIRKSC